MGDSKREAQIRDWWLEHDGFLDADQPTESAHIQHRERMRAPFTPDERALIRSLLFGGDS